MRTLKHFITLVISSILLATTLGCKVKNRTFPPKTKWVNTKSFVYIRKTMNYKYCSASMSSMCAMQEVPVTASGFLVHYDPEKNISVIGTAKHVCDHHPVPRVLTGPLGQKVELKEIQTSVIFTDENAKYVELKEPNYWSSKDYDLCFYVTKGKIAESPIKIAKEAPKKGDMLYNIAAPSGVWSTGASPVFVGQFLGDVKKKDFAFFGMDYINDLHFSVTNLPAMPGSSGSPILNSKGELVSVLYAIPNVPKYTHISYGVPFEIVRNGLISTKRVFGLKRLTIPALK